MATQLELVLPFGTSIVPTVNTLGCTVSGSGKVLAIGSTPDASLPGALQLDTSLSGVISISNIPTMTTWTYEFWVQSMNLGGSLTMVAVQHTDVPGYPGLQLKQGSVIFNALKWPQNEQTLNWNHYALVNNGTFVGLYINGKTFSNMNTPIEKFNMGNTLTLGLCSLKTANSYQGFMSDFRLYNYTKYSANFVPRMSTTLLARVPLVNPYSPQITALNDQIKRGDAAISSANNTIFSTKQLLTASIDSVATCKSASDVMATQTNVLQKTIAKDAALLEDIRAQLYNSENSVQSTKDLLTASIDSLHSCKNASNEMTSQINVLQQTITSDALLLQDMRTELSKSEASIQQANQRVTSCTDSKSTLSKEVDTLTATLADALSNLTTCSTAKTALDVNLTLVETALQEAKNTLYTTPHPNVKMYKLTIAVLTVLLMVAVWKASGVKKG